MPALPACMHHQALLLLVLVRRVLKIKNSVPPSELVRWNCEEKHHAPLRLSHISSPLPDSGPLAFLLAGEPHHRAPGTQAMTDQKRLQGLNNRV